MISRHFNHIMQMITFHRATEWQVKGLSKPTALEGDLDEIVERTERI
jgi:hypothetical protein